MSNEYKPTYVDNTDNSISIMESTDTISFCKTGTKINTLSAKNVAHKKSGEDLNLCAFNNSSFNPIITINNNNQDCRIMTNLNVSGNLNINSTGCINLPVGITSSRPSNPNTGTIRYNNDTYNFEGYANGSWVNLSTPSSLYTFSSHIFTNAGVTGRIGPSLSQLQNAYIGNIWTTNLDFFNVIYGGYQIWTVPQTGKYRIKAYGASGGNVLDNLFNNERRGAGRGGITQGNFILNQGEKILIIVGQTISPTTFGTAYAGGGGGATWVLRADKWGTIDSNLYCVAGGGGGASMRLETEGTNITVEDAKDEQNSLITNWSSAQSTSHGSGGAYSAGGGSYGIKGGEGPAGNDSSGGGGIPYDNTLAIGGVTCVHYTGSNEGGFGGGGGGAWKNGGGGGGYKGGDGSRNQATEGGHGGSYRNNGISGTTIFAKNSGINGAVEITFMPEVSTSSLYDFTSFTFTNCNKTGHEGPTLAQARSVYTPSWTDNNTYFNVVNGIQYWTVPKNGNYTIKAYGADALNRRGGRGAIITGTFTLVGGEIIRILIGQRPHPYINSNGCGAGGTFVVKSPYNTDTSILVIAGGGGGGHDFVSPDNLNKHGQALVVGGRGGGGTGTGSVTANPIFNISGGNNGSSGGGQASAHGGAGFYENGYNNSMSTSGEVSQSFISLTPGIGGVISSNSGGFGGGSRHGNTEGAGGGGYSGGAASTNNPYQGGGGGSYNNGFNQYASVGQTNGWNNQGKVEITFVGESFPPPPPWEIIMSTNQSKYDWHSETLTRNETAFGSPGTTTWRSCSLSNTGAENRDSIGVGANYQGPGLYKAFFTKTNITKIALVDDSTDSMNPYDHTKYVIFDLTHSEPHGTGFESIYDILKRLDQVRVDSTETYTAFMNNRANAASTTGFTGGFNGYSGTKIAQKGDWDNCDFFCIWGIYHYSDSDQGVLCIYKGHLGNASGGKGANQWLQNYNLSKETLWSYWGGDSNTASSSRTIGNMTTANEGYPGHIFNHSNTSESDTSRLFLLAC